MHKDYSQYPGLDWSSCLERTGNNAQLASELLEMFLKDVPKEVDDFKDAYSIKNYTALKELAHRMRGALAYCVIPNLDSALQLLEKAAHNENRDEVAKFYAVVMIQLKKLLPAKTDDNNNIKDTLHACQADDNSKAAKTLH